jgi:hypothetical protein
MVAPGRVAPPAPIKLGVVLPNRIAQGQVGGVNVPAGSGVFTAPGRVAPPRPILLQPGPALPRQQTKDRQQNALQEGLRSSTAQAKANPLGGANLLESYNFPAAGTYSIPHNLGRVFRSATLQGLSASVAWSIQRPSGIAADAQVVTITVSAPVVADVLVW